MLNQFFIFCGFNLFISKTYIEYCIENLNKAWQSREPYSIKIYIINSHIYKLLMTKCVKMIQLSESNSLEKKRFSNKFSEIEAHRF